MQRSRETKVLRAGWSLLFQNAKKEPSATALYDQFGHIFIGIATTGIMGIVVIKIIL